MPTLLTYSVAQFGGGTAAVDVLARRLVRDVINVCPILGITVTVPDGAALPYTATPIFAASATLPEQALANALCALFTGSATIAVLLALDTGPAGPTGATGAQGVAGAAGATGAKGTAGGLDFGMMEIPIGVSDDLRFQLSLSGAI